MVVFFSISFYSTRGATIEFITIVAEIRLSFLIALR